MREDEQAALRQTPDSNGNAFLVESGKFAVDIFFDIKGEVPMAAPHTPSRGMRTQPTAIFAAAPVTVYSVLLTGFLSAEKHRRWDYIQRPQKYPLSSIP